MVDGEVEVWRPWAVSRGVGGCPAVVPIVAVLGWLVDHMVSFSGVQTSLVALVVVTDVDVVLSVSQLWVVCR